MELIWTFDRMVPGSDIVSVAVGCLLCIYEFVVWPTLFSLIFADVYIRHPRITTKEELKTVL